MTRAFDPGSCPLCAQPNHCAMATNGCSTAGTACWCADVTIARAVLEKVPADAVGRACVCADCAKTQNVHRVRD